MSNTCTVELTMSEAAAIVLCRDMLPASLIDKAIKAVTIHIVETERTVARLKAEIDAIDHSRLSASLHKNSVQGDNTD